MNWWAAPLFLVGLGCVLAAAVIIGQDIVRHFRKEVHEPGTPHPFPANFRTVQHPPHDFENWRSEDVL